MGWAHGGAGRRLARARARRGSAARKLKSPRGCSCNWVGAGCVGGAAGHAAAARQPPGRTAALGPVRTAAPMAPASMPAAAAGLPGTAWPLACRDGGAVLPCRQMAACRGAWRRLQPGPGQPFTPSHAAHHPARPPPTKQAVQLEDGGVEGLARRLLVRNGHRACHAAHHHAAARHAGSGAPLQQASHPPGPPSRAHPAAALRTTTQALHGS